MGGLARLQQSSHLQVAHRESRFLKQPGQLALNDLSGAEMCAFLDNKDLFRARSRKKLWAGDTALRAAIGVDQVMLGCTQHAMRL